MIASRPSLSVIVPLADDPRQAAEIFDTLEMSGLPRHKWELVVVADGQREATIDRAAQHADVIVRLGGGLPHGPAYLYNRGAEAARAPVLVFLDHDVVVYPETLSRIDRAFADESLEAIVAGIDPAPSGDTTTCYATLVQDWAHRRCLGESEHFTTRAAAIRSQVFFAVGQLDEWDRPPVDCAATEFGLRLRALGHRSDLRDDIRVANRSHVRWTQAVQPSAIQQLPPPWLPEPVNGPTMTATRQLRLRERRLSMSMWGGAALLGVAGGMGSTRLAGGAALMVLAVLAVDAPLTTYVARRGGLAVALSAIPLRVASLLVQGARALAYRIRSRIIGEPRPEPGVEALTEVGVEHWPPTPMRSRAAGVDKVHVTPEMADVGRS